MTGLSIEIRIVALFDGRIEGVAVEMGDGERVELGMGGDAPAAAGGAARGALFRVGETVAAEGAHCGSRGLCGHSQAAPRTPLESPWRFFTMRDAVLPASKACASTRAGNSS